MYSKNVYQWLPFSARKTLSSRRPGEQVYTRSAPESIQQSSENHCADRHPSSFDREEDEPDGRA